MVFKALKDGRRVGCFREACFVHSREYGLSSIRTFGHSAYVLGYLRLFVLGRISRELLQGNPMKALYLLIGYVEYSITGKPQLTDVHDTVKLVQRERMRHLLYSSVRA